MLSVERYEDPNAKWAHAISAESMMKKKEAIAQLDYMRTLFYECLPIGDRIEHIDNYFNELEKIIYTKENADGINYEEFSDPEPCEATREYRYNSATVFKERSERRHHLLPSGEGMESPSDGHVRGDAVPSEPSDAEYLQRIHDSPPGDDF